MKTHREEVLEALGIDIASDEPMTQEEAAKLVEFIDMTEAPATVALREKMLEMIFQPLGVPEKLLLH